MSEQEFRILPLDTERLVLRRFCQDDLRDVVEWEEYATGDPEPEAQKFLAFCFRQYEERGDGPWGMLLKQTGKMVGNCGYIALQQYCGEVNYYVAPRYRGQGFAPEALKALLHFGFSELGLLRIQARCGLDNFSSERVLQKVGMKFEGLLRHASATGESPEQKMYAILRQDFALGAAPPGL